MRTLSMWGALLGAALILPQAVEAQGPAGQTATAAVTTVATNGDEPAELAFEREVFTYPTFTRRNPFQTLLAGEDAGPRWEGMQLEGVLHDADPQYSIAIVSSGRANGGSAADGSSGQTARLRVGQRWGNIRVLAIHPDNILIEVEEFGLTEQRTMRLPARGQGGQR